MKSRITKVFILAIVALMLFGTVLTSAYESYDTYTYSIDGKPLLSPAAYTPDVSVYDSKYMGLVDESGQGGLGMASDIVTDKEGNFFIADSVGNRIVVLDKYTYRVKEDVNGNQMIIDHYYDEYNVRQTFNAPTGVYVTDPNKMIDKSENIFVCDTQNRKVVVFDKDFNYERTITVPDDPAEGETTTSLITKKDFAPTAIAVDIYGRIFVVSKDCFSGIVVMSGEGDFTGFIGAQKITADPLTLLWEKFQSVEDRESNFRELPDPYNNIAVDDLGFVYATISFSNVADKKNQLEAIKGKEAAYSPVKKLNSVGKEILKRNGFFDPGGEVDVLLPTEVSTITDIAIGNEGSWSILDKSRSRIFTYDSNGNLLFAFGDTGNQIGNGASYTAMTYQVLYDEKTGKDVYNLVLLDQTGGDFRLMVYHPTDYYELIMNALHNQNEHNYSATIQYWQDVLTRNNNFDLAYVGIGKALYNLGDYEGAMEMLKNAYETEVYSLAFAAMRKDILSRWLLPLIIVLIVALVFFFKFLGWAKKKNKAVALKVGKKTYLEELLYVFHLVFHPFDGFWDLKHEKRGSVKSATTILALTVVAFFYQSIGQGYIFNPRGDYSTVIMQMLGILVPVLLWVISNWCLTTLFDGEGSLKDIYIATCYSLAPLPLFITISTILTNVLTISEQGIINMIAAIGWVWVVILLFFGMVVTHDYSTGKNVITTLGTIVAMCVIMFIVILFSSLVVKMVTFVVSIITEISNKF
ncbi:MAG: YIP1 family protein [Clostridia bacterium]|nr:YIP1 family protein [Clostridia bacterium]